MTFSLMIRGLRQPAAEARTLTADEPLAAMKAALDVQDYPAPEPVIIWKSGTAELAAADVDYHGVEAPHPTRLETLLLCCEPRPVWHWRTHGGGVRAIFGRSGDFEAGELAAAWLASYAAKAAALGVRPTGLELKCDTRHPAYPKRDSSTAGPVGGKGVQTLGDLGELAGLLGRERSVDDERVSEWLASAGLEKGRAYEHDRCPIEPGRQSHGKPVFVGDFGLNCLSCGQHLGSGFVPYSRLVNAEGVTLAYNPLAAAVRGFCHWEHARHIVAELGFNGRLGEQVYRALLKLAHLARLGPADEKLKAGMLSRVERVFFPAVPMIRVAAGYWAQPVNMATAYSDGVPEMLRALPATLYADRETGELRHDQLRFGIFKSNADLADYGYPALVPIRGVDCDADWRLTRQLFYGDREKVVYVTLPADPPYRGAAVPLAEAEATLRRCFPGVRLDVLRLLMAAKIFAQRNGGEPPRILLVGQSRAGKSAHVYLAAELACDSVGDVRLDRDYGGFLQAFAESCDRQTYTFIDEIDKVKMPPAEWVRYLQSTKRGVFYRKLYVGRVPITNPGAIVYADTAVPDGLRKETQIARRVVLVELGAGVNAAGVDWRKTCETRDIQGWRKGRPEFTAAADTLMADVIDRFAGRDTFEEVAAALGFSTLQDADNGDGLDVGQCYRELFGAVCQLPDTLNANWRGRGWKVLDPTTETDAAKALREVAADASEGTADNYQAITGAQWGRLVGIDGLVCDVRQRSRRQVGLRFRDGDAKAEGTRFNAELTRSQSESICASTEVQAA